MDYSTPITERMVKEVLSDLVKVIITWQNTSPKNRKKVDTGK
jgi:hypothetical protein